ncbi:MAG: large conductance mechanosensitive channel protein MscL [Actinomycetota bacterium]|nr:large conductance mechanosensitive channel protein MscL [Actinomycetota bacterium]
MLKDFKAFILRGNVVDLAVGVVIGVAFADLVKSFVDNLLTPFVAIPGTKDFRAYAFAISDSTFSYGLFINALITFLLIAVAVFFFVVKPVNALMTRRKTEPDVESVTKECDYCLSNVPARAIVCAFCTREIDRPAVS